MNKNTVYILQKDYESPICKVHKGFRYTAKEWLRYFPKLSPEDFDIKTDWFKPKDDLQAVNSVRTEWWEEEIIKCIKSPYYFATQYLIVNDKPFTTPLNEKQFNSYFGMKQQFYAPKEHVDESKPTEQFQWDESLAREFGDLCNQEGWHHFSGKKNIDTLLEQFKQSKSKTEQPSPKEEQVPIKVQMISFYTSMSEKLIRDVFSVRLTGDISEDKLQSIKEAIEGVLNGVQGQKVEISDHEYFNRGYSTGWKDAHKYNNKKYTEEQLLQARRDAFDAARVRIATYDGEQYFPTTKVKYKDNEDYINTLNK